MIIQELIKSKVLQMDANSDTFTFQHSEKDWQNLEADEKLYPAVFLDMPVKVTPIITRGGGIEERYQCVLTFLYKSNLDSDPDDQYATLKKCHAAMNQFVLMVEDDTENFDTTKNTFGQAFQAINLFDVNLDAIVLPFTCTPRNRPDACIPSYSLPISDCDPATVQSSGGLFSQLVASGDTFTLLDVGYTFTNSENTVIVSGTVEAQSDIVGMLPDIDFTDSNGTTTQEASGKNLVCTPSVLLPNRPKLYKTGQTSSYVTGDDGDVGAGDGNSFLVLSENNIFGNTDRFTDELGTQIYANGVVIDHYTKWLDGSKVLGYAKSPSPSNINWLDSNAYCLSFSTGGFTGWRQGNIIEITDLIYYTGGGLDYAPFNISQYIWLWTSTSKSSTISFRVQNTGSGSVNNTGAYCRALPVREFTITGTTLT